MPAGGKNLEWSGREATRRRSEEEGRARLTTVAGPSARIPRGPGRPLTALGGRGRGWRRHLGGRGTGRKVYADDIVVVVADADPAAERRGWVRAGASPRLHREAASLRARRPGGPGRPSAVNRAVGYPHLAPRAARASVLRRRIVALPCLTLAAVGDLRVKSLSDSSNTLDSLDGSEEAVDPDLCVLGARVRVGVGMRVLRGPVLARKPRAPGAPAAVHGIRQHRTLCHLLVPVIGQVVVLRSRGAFHEMLVPAAVRLLGVQASLPAAMTMTLASRNPATTPGIDLALARTRDSRRPRRPRRPRVYLSRPSSVPT